MFPIEIISTLILYQKLNYIQELWYIGEFEAHSNYVYIIENPNDISNLSYDVLYTSSYCCFYCMSTSFKKKILTGQHNYIPYASFDKACSPLLLQNPIRIWNNDELKKLAIVYGIFE